MNDEKTTERKQIVVDVPRRIRCQADASEATATFVGALNEYLTTHVVEDGVRYGRVKVVPEIGYVNEVTSFHFEQLRQLFPDEDWDRVIPMQAVINRVRAMNREMERLKSKLASVAMAEAASALLQAADHLDIARAKVLEMEENS